MATIEIKVPDIGDFAEVAVIELLVKVGDRIKAEQSLVTVESEKASMEIPSSHAGVVKEWRVKLGDKVSKGSVVLLLEAEGNVAVSPAVAVPEVLAVAPVVPAPVVASDAASVSASQRESPVTALPVPINAPAAATVNTASTVASLPYASPSVRKLARQLGVPLQEVKGTAPKGRITVEDVQAFSRAVMQGKAQTQAMVVANASAAPVAAAGAVGGLNLLPWPTVDFAQYGSVERRDLGRIQKISAANLLRNAVMIPAVTNHDDADVTELEAFRVQLNKEQEKSGIKVTMLAFLIKACVAALKQFPQFNSSLDGEQLVLKKYWHIGFAADTPNGLMVPVLKDADQKGVLQISAELAELSKKARDGKLSPAEMRGASFTISSLGGIGGRYFTPIINAPEVAILGVCKSRIEPVWDGQAFQPRLMLPLSLTWDHRVIDGAAAARFNVHLAQLLGDMRRIVL
jgi:pyruvate dehydrogenase E2 component (dihydrolipoamide acetyltransferase)